MRRKISLITHQSFPDERRKFYPQIHSSSINEQLDEVCSHLYDAAEYRMPNKHAAIKALRKNRRHAADNLRIKRNVKALYAKGVSLLKVGNKTEALAMVRAFQQTVDKAAKRHVVSPNAAARKKSTLLRLVNAA